MNLIKLVEMLDLVETRAGEIKAEDIEPLNKLHRMLSGVETMVITTEDTNLLEKVYKYITDNKGRKTLN